MNKKLWHYLGFIALAFLILEAIITKTTKGALLVPFVLGVVLSFLIIYFEKIPMLKSYKYLQYVLLIIVGVVIVYVLNT